MGPALELASSSVEDTRSIGQAVGSLLDRGDVVSLTGDLGAGKTTFVQGAAAGIGVSQPVLSPTFTLVRQYAGRHEVYHMDVYRLDRLQDVLDLGFEEILDRGGVVFVEWGDVIDALLPENYLQVELELPDEETAPRRLRLSGQGPRWAARWDRMAELAARWKT